MSEVTRVLIAVEQSNSNAVDELIPAVYKELQLLTGHKLARSSRLLIRDITN